MTQCDCGSLRTPRIFRRSARGQRNRVYRSRLLCATSSVVENYKREVKRLASKEITDLPKVDCQRIVAKIQALAKDPRPHGCEKLSGAEKYRVRQGDSRILYEINDSSRTVTVVKVGNRKEVCR